MNKRLIELYKQAEKSVAFLSNSKQSKDRIVQQKFAELIVRECAGQCLSDDCMRILNHFGVEDIGQ